MVDSKKNAPSAAKTERSSVAGKDKVYNNQDYGEDLVGSKIRVWWPLDCKFYNGVVDAFYTSTKKHRVFYEDGDKETLDMKKERWEVIEEDDDDNDDNHASVDEISIHEKSGEQSTETTQEPETMKFAKSNGKKGDVRWKIVASASRTRTIKSIYEATNQRQTNTSSALSEDVSDKVTEPKNFSKKNNMRNKEEEGGSEKPFDDNSRKYKEKKNKYEDGDDDDDEESYDDDSKKNKIDDKEGGDDEESYDDDSKKKVEDKDEGADEEPSYDDSMKNKMEGEDGVNNDSKKN